MVKVEAGRISDVLEQSSALPGVVSVSAVTGPADLIVRIEARDSKELADLVMSRLHAVPGVRETDTRFVVG